MTLSDVTHHEDIPDRYRVAPFVETLLERALRWYGHVIRPDETSLAEIRLNQNAETAIARYAGW